MPRLESARFTTIALALLLSGCPSVGHKRVPTDSFNYNAAMARSRDEQMLLNIVRMKYIELPDFLAVSSVITSYTFEGSVSGAATVGNGIPGDSVAAGGNVGYSERPTITYAPLAGREFSLRLLTPIPIDVVFGLGQSGWPTDLLLKIALQSINGVQNMSFSQVPAPGDVDRDTQFAVESARLERFQLLTQTLVQLGQYGLAEFLREKELNGEDDSVLKLHFETVVSEEGRVTLEELRELLQLEPGRSSFRITSRITGRDAGEVTIQTRSLLAIMSFLSHGIDVPTEDIEAGRVVSFTSEVAEEIQRRIPIRIRSSDEPPEDAMVAVAYRGRWFFIADSDVQSKRTFSTVLALFQLTAPSAGAAAPLLTLPTGG